MPAAGFTASEAQVTAVHISELPDPTGYLSGGELLLTTGMLLPTNRIGWDQPHEGNLFDHLYGRRAIQRVA